MTEILHILRKHGHTDMGITIPRPPPMGGRGNKYKVYNTIFNKVKRKAKSQYYCAILEENKTNMDDSE